MRYLCYLVGIPSVNSLDSRDHEDIRTDITPGTVHAIKSAAAIMTSLRMAQGGAGQEEEENSSRYTLRSSSSKVGSSVGDMLQQRYL